MCRSDLKLHTNLLVLTMIIYTTICYDRCTVMYLFISTVSPLKLHLLSDGLSPVEEPCLHTSDERGAENLTEKRRQATRQSRLEQWK